MSNTEHNNTEIERKFLVKGNEFLAQAHHASKITQGYLSLTPEKTVRIRIKDEQGFITIKGKRSANGLSRFEWEKEIALQDAKEMMELCGDDLIEKIRHYVDFEGHTFEVDVFHGNNEGLIVAEIELSSEEETFEKPSWLGKEVTDDKRYHNSRLIQHPYKTW